MSNDNLNKIRLNILLLGDNHSGKTTFINSLINKNWITSYNYINSVDLHKFEIKINETLFIFYFYDTNGRNTNNKLIIPYLKECPLALVFYRDNLFYTKSNLVLSITNWIDLYLSKNHNGYIILMKNMNIDKSNKYLMGYGNKFLLNVNDINNNRILSQFKFYFNCKNIKKQNSNFITLLINILLENTKQLSCNNLTKNSSDNNDYIWDFNETRGLSCSQ